VSMSQAHPCPKCGHSSDAECGRAAGLLRLDEQVQCLHCLHVCLHRAVANPSPPGAMAQPSHLEMPAPTPPMPSAPLPDLTPPTGR
jgi:hypothetical protein